jgi:hypothetical protein
MHWQIDHFDDKQCNAILLRCRRKRFIACSVCRSYGYDGKEEVSAMMGRWRVVAEQE